MNTMEDATLAGSMAEVDPRQNKAWEICFDANRRRIITALRESSITRVLMEFEGSRDAGRVDVPIAYGLDNEVCAFPPIKVGYQTSPLEKNPRDRVPIKRALGW